VLLLAAVDRSVVAARRADARGRPAPLVLFGGRECEGRPSCLSPRGGVVCIMYNPKHPKSKVLGRTTFWGGFLAPPRLSLGS
jgi:hypothetical protein